MKIGLIGLGTVGGTLFKWFDENTEHELALYDPPKGLADSLKGCDAIFISVPVSHSTAGQDTKLLEEVVQRAQQSCKNVFIRSTVLPGTNDRLGTIAMPEFLTERRAYQDFCDLPILMGEKADDLDLEEMFPGKEFLIMPNTECELSKFAHNCFGAMKVIYFNIIEEMCRKLNASFDYVKSGAKLTGFIEMEHHTQVPGPDGHRGYGGKCFPENIKAMKAFLTSPAMDMIGPSLFFQGIHQLNAVYRFGPPQALALDKQPTPVSER
jgi:UDP-glucose 6-dehydrogenase